MGAICVSVWPPTLRLKRTVLPTTCIAAGAVSTAGFTEDAAVRPGATPTNGALGNGFTTPKPGTTVVGVPMPGVIVPPSVENVATGGATTVAPRPGCTIAVPNGTPAAAGVSAFSGLAG